MEVLEERHGNSEDEDEGVDADVESNFGLDDSDEGWSVVQKNCRSIQRERDLVVCWTCH